MKISFLTIFPPVIEAYLSESIMAKAIAGGLLECEVVNIRQFSMDKHRKCDDYPYGGGAGMVFKPEPLAAALDSVLNDHARVVYPSPSGLLFSQKEARKLAAEQHLVFICGRYEGIDQRIIDTYVDYEYSIGDYILSSGEIAALTITDTVYRLLDGVINPESLAEESFEDGLLEYPHYTRPDLFCNIGVPEVLLSGHHQEIRKWRLEQQILKTVRNRPDLLDSNAYPDEVQKIIDRLIKEAKG